MSEITPRQSALLDALRTQNTEPIPGQALARQLGVTRQVVVHDIALLRALGHQILSTPKGYILQTGSTRQRTLLAVSHPPDKADVELYTLIDCGLSVVDVRVEHQIYGEITGNLYLSSRRDIDHFLAKVNDQNVPLLSSLTDGVHYHLVEYDHDQQLKEAVQQLQHSGIEVFDWTS